MPKPGYFEFEGMHPSGVGRVVFRVAKDGLLKHLRDTGNSAMYLDSMLLPAVLRAPTAVFEGLNRPGQEKNLCFCGKPSEKYLKDEHITVPPPPGKTFLIFATADFKVIKFGWEDEDQVMMGFPIGHQTRFGRRLWPAE
jgi:hypothetical protein